MKSLKIKVARALEILHFKIVINAFLGEDRECLLSAFCKTVTFGCCLFLRLLQIFHFALSVDNSKNYLEMQKLYKDTNYIDANMLSVNLFVAVDDTYKTFA